MEILRREGGGEIERVRAGCCCRARAAEALERGGAVEAGGASGEAGVIVEIGGRAGGAGSGSAEAGQAQRSAGSARDASVCEVRPGRAGVVAGAIEGVLGGGTAVAVAHVVDGEGGSEGAGGAEGPGVAAGAGGRAVGAELRRGVAELARWAGLRAAVRDVFAEVGARTGPDAGARGVSVGDHSVGGEAGSRAKAAEEVVAGHALEAGGG